MFFALAVVDKTSSTYSLTIFVLALDDVWQVTASHQALHFPFATKTGSACLSTSRLQNTTKKQAHFCQIIALLLIFQSQLYLCLS